MSLVVSLDGTDVSGVAIEGSATRRLNRPAQATIKIPMDAAIGGPGSRLKISFDAGASLFFHGMVMDCETDAGEDDGYTVYNASDPMELWAWRPARDGPGSADPGDFSNPSMFLGVDYFPGAPQILEQCLLQSADGSDPALGEGDLFLDLAGSTFATGVQSMEGAPTDWPMRISDVASLMASTGVLDMVITPTDPGGGIMGTIDCYNGNYGQNHSTGIGGDGTVVLQYGMGALNVRALRWNEDMSSICNKLYYYGGPRRLTTQDPEGNQHWCFNITGDDCELYGNRLNEFGALSGGPFSDAGPGGALPTSLGTCGGAGSPYVGGVLGDMRADSQDTAGPSGTGYGVRVDIKIFDAASNLCAGKNGFSYERWLYRQQWQSESWARVYPRDLVHVTPIRGYPLGTFDIGDLVTVEAGAQIKGGFSGAQRIYEYSISWDEDYPFAISELLTGSDAGIPLGTP